MVSNECFSRAVLIRKVKQFRFGDDGFDYLLSSFSHDGVVQGSRTEDNDCFCWPTLSTVAMRVAMSSLRCSAKVTGRVYWPT